MVSAYQSIAVIKKGGLILLFFTSSVLSGCNGFLYPLGYVHRQPTRTVVPCADASFFMTDLVNKTPHHYAQLPNGHVCLLPVDPQRHNYHCILKMDCHAQQSITTKQTRKIDAL